ncbi:hypothetical protein JCM10212_005578 [Sporobolomyces blumeae]
MSYSRRSSFSGAGQMPSPRSPPTGGIPSHSGAGYRDRPPRLRREPDDADCNVAGFDDPTRTASVTATSLSTDAPSRPIPISPTSSYHGNYLAQRYSNLEWAIRHNDEALMRTERAAIERYRQAEGQARQDEVVSEESDQSFEIQVKDVSKTRAVSSGVKYSNGRRMSCLANYTGLPSPSTGDSSSYSVNLDGGYLKAPSRSTSARAPSPSRRSASGSTGGGGVRRPSSPYRASGLVSPLTSLPSPQHSRSHREASPSRRGASPSRPHYTASASDPIASTIRRPPSPRGGGARPPSPSRHHSQPSGPGPAQTRVIHGFQVPATANAPPRPPSPGRASHSHSHSISRGRAGSVSMAGGLGSGNSYQAAMEQQASRDFQILDGERYRGRSGLAGSGEGEGGGGGGGGRAGRRRSSSRVDGRMTEAQERMRKGYSLAGTGATGEPSA